MKGVLLSSCLLFTQWIYAQCTVVSFDIEVVSNVSCPGEDDGIATAISMVIPFGGTTTYEWSSAGNLVFTGNSVGNLSAGIYTVTLSNSLGCVDTKTVEVIEPQHPIIEVVSQDVSCFGMNNGEAVVEVIGTSSPYVVDFGSQNATQLFAGTHLFSVVDANGCSFQDSVIISQPEEIQPAYNVTHVGCNGGYDGVISVEVLNSTNTTFLWNTGSTTATVENLSAGIYSVTISDGNNCSVSLQEIEVLQPEMLELTVFVEDALCAESNNGSVNVEVEGGVEPYSFNYFGFHPDSLSVGYYTMEVADALSCVKETQFTISAPSVLTASTIVEQVSCFGDNDGLVEVFVDGGVEPYVVDWYGENNMELTAGEYPVMVTDFNSCVLNLMVSVEEPDSLFASLTTHDASCYGVNDGSVEIDSISGGVAPYNQVWSSGFDSNLIAGSYSLLLTDAKGCVFSDTIVIYQPDSLIVEVTKTDVFCNGDSTGSVNLLVSGGVLPYGIDWQEENPSMLAAGVYTFFVSDFNSCQIIDSVLINEPNDLVVQAAINHVSCYGNNDGSVNIVVTGGVSPYDIDFGGIDTVQLSAGEYGVVLLDANGCSDSVSFQISQPDSLSVFASVTNVSCYGFSDGQISLDIQGGTGMYIQDWFGFNPESLVADQYAFQVLDENNCIFVDSIIIAEPDSLFAETTIENATCFGFLDGSVELLPIGGVAPYQVNWAGQDSIALGAGDYVFSVTDSNGCVLDVAVAISENSEIIIDSDVVDASCFRSADGEIELSVEGGLAPYTCMWSNGGNEFVNQGLLANFYDVLVTDSVGCERYVSLEVMQPDSIQLLFKVQMESCTGIGDGVLSASAIGGVSPYLLQWDNGAEDWILNNVETGLYTLTLIDANGCYVEDTISMTGYEPCFLLPTLFTPNNDGYNDSWNIQGMSKYPLAQVKVFTRSGQLVFEQIGYELDWDGTYNGIPLPNGDYYYYLDLKEGSEVMQGVVTIKK